MIGCLQTHVRKQPIIALYFEFEIVSNEPVSSIRYKLACAYSEDSNRPSHPHSLFLPEETLDPWLPIKCPSQTLIRLSGPAG